MKLNDPAANYYYNHPTATNGEKRIRTFTDGRTWQESNILAREVELINFAISRWSMPCVCDNAVLTWPDPFDELQPPPEPINIAEDHAFGEYDEQPDDDDAEYGHEADIEG